MIRRIRWAIISYCIWKIIVRHPEKEAEILKVFKKMVAELEAIVTTQGDSA